MKTKNKSGRKSISVADKKIPAGIWVRAKNLKKIKPLLEEVVKKHDT